MLRKTTLTLLVLLSSGALRAAAADALPPATSWIPQEAVLVVQITQPKAILDHVFDDRVVKAVTSHPVYREQIVKPQSQQALNLLSHFKRDLKTLLSNLFGGGITWAVSPDGGNLLIVDAEDPKLLMDVHEFLLSMAKNDRPGQVNSAEYRGVTGWTFGKNEAHAIIGTRLVLANKPDVLKAALDLYAEPERASLAKSAVFQQAQSSVKSDSLVTAFADMSVLGQVPQLQKALTRNEDAMTTLLFAPLLSALRNADWLTAGISVRGETVALEFATDGSPSDASAPDGFAVPSGPEDGALPNVSVPRQIAALSLYRDLPKFYAAKDALFPERSSGIIFFENMMGIFFTGKEFTAEVLAQTAPDIRLVVAEQKYEPAVGTPELQLPAFAVVFRLRDPVKSAPIMEEAWQKALGLINFTRGQAAQPGLIIDKATYGDVKYSVAKFQPVAEANRSQVDTRFNFEPTLAMPDDFMILGSSDALTRDVIDALKKEKADGVKPLPGTHSEVTAAGVQLASILRANRAAMVRQNMVEEGNTQQQAEVQLDLLMTALQHMSRFAISAGTDQGQARLTLSLDVDLP